MSLFDKAYNNVSVSPFKNSSINWSWISCHGYPTNLYIPARCVSMLV